MPESVTPSARNPWKLTAIGMGFVAATALATGIVVASRSKPEDKPVAVQPAPAERARVEGARPVAAATAPARVPDQTIVKACNDQAAAATGPRDKTTEVVKDGAVGALLGAAVGAAGGALAGGGERGGKGAPDGGPGGGRAGNPVRGEDKPQHRGPDCRGDSGRLRG